jgi:hypothetical protein
VPRRAVSVSVTQWRARKLFHPFLARSSLHNRRRTGRRRRESDAVRASSIVHRPSSIVHRPSSIVPGEASREFRLVGQP